jgi:SAM-dependent methyltransferase
MKNESEDKLRYDQKAIQSVQTKWAKEIGYMISRKTFFSNRWAHYKWGNWLLKSEIKAHQRICECGCFLGIPSIFLSLTRPKVNVYAFDISPLSMVKSKRLCEELGADVCLFASDFKGLPFENNSFEWMFGFGVLHHCHFRETFEEIERVLSPGGRALFIEPHTLNPLIRGYRKMRREPYSATERPYDFKMFKEIQKWAPQLEVSWVFEHFFCTFLVLVFKLLKPLRKYVGWLSFYVRIQRITGKVDDTLLLLFPFLRSYSQQVVIHLKKK